MQRLDPSEKKVLKIWGMVAVVLTVIVLIINIGNGNIEEIFNHHYIKVDDANRYATVSSAISKYYAFINNEDYQSVVNIMNDSYKRENSIDVNNVKNFITDNPKSITYETRIMCAKETSKKGIYSYYVSGFEIEANTGIKLTDKYYEVILDGNTFHFNLRPVNENEFRGECNE